MVPFNPDGSLNFTYDIDFDGSARLPLIVLGGVSVLMRDVSAAQDIVAVLRAWESRHNEKASMIDAMVRTVSLQDEMLAVYSDSISTMTNRIKKLSVYR
jgi:hypothetical protein